MNQPAWERVEAVFREAVALPRGQRSLYLDHACAGDTILRQEVESLLQADEADGGYLDRGMDQGILEGMDQGRLMAALQTQSRTPKEMTPMMQRCQQGHFFDSSRHMSCPHCGVPGLAMDPGATRPVGNPMYPGYPGQAPNPVHGAPDEKTQAKKVADEGATVGVYKAKLGIEPVVGWLVCVEGPDKGRDFRIRSQRNFIGRDARMDVCISGDDQISRENHATVVYDARGNNFRLAPGDAHGMVYLNGESVDTPMPLKSHDVIELGVSKLLFIPLCSEAFQWQ